MKIKAQLAAVFNLDKCLGCSTCTVACKNLWTNRKGAEYMWWNNVETKPGIGYPKQWEDQEKYKGGWTPNGGAPKLRLGGKFWEMVNIFFNSNEPTISDYYGTHPFTFTYEDLHDSKALDQQPVARPKSLITGQEDIALKWGVNWEDDAAGTHETGKQDVNFRGMGDEERDTLLQFQDIFMFYLPRICNHCLNPACVGACTSGAAYKREEDGIVLIDQDRCRGWRYCVTACPYKKPYYNWASGKMEKCLLCYPRVEAGDSPACFHSCPGKIRYLGVLLYDLDKVAATTSLPDDQLVQGQRDVILDPFDKEVAAQARADGIPEAWLDAAKRSPTYFMFKKWQIALPLHAEFRTLPSIFYIPPESPMMNAFNKQGVHDVAAEWLPQVDQLRIPVKYLSSLLGAGNDLEARRALKRLIAVRQYNRSLRVDHKANANVLDDVGLTEEEAKHMHRLLALAFLNERFAIPTAHREKAVEPYTDGGIAGFRQMVGGK